MFVSPTVVGNAVILGSCAGSIHTVDGRTGTPIWRYDTGADGPAAQFHGEPLVMGERIIIPSDAESKGHLYSFDTATGDLKWKLPSDRGFATTPILVGDRVIAISAEGEVVAVEPKSGEVIWRRFPAGKLKPIPFVQSPAVAGGRVFIADNTGKALALDVVTGATLWQKTLTARANTALVVAGNHLIVGTIDGSIHWIAADSGATNKRLQMDDGYAYGTPIVAPPLLFILTAGAKGHLIALDAQSGAARWKRETAKEWTTFRPLITGTTLIAGTSEKSLCAFDRNTGKERWCRSVGQEPRGLGISDDGILYVGSVSGVVQAFRIPNRDTP